MRTIFVYTFSLQNHTIGTSPLYIRIRIPKSNISVEYRGSRDLIGLAATPLWSLRVQLHYGHSRGTSEVTGQTADIVMASVHRDAAH